MEYYKAMKMKGRPRYIYQLHKPLKHNIDHQQKMET